VVAVPIMAAVMLVVSGKKEPRLPLWLLGWLAAAAMALAAGLMIWSSWSAAA